MLAGVVVALPDDPELQQAFTERYMRPRRNQCREALRRGLDRCELRPGIDDEALFDQLYGALYLRLLTGRPLTAADVDRAVTQAFTGILLADTARA